MRRHQRLETALQQFSPDLLEVIDESEKHHGHSGWREGGETHYRIRIRAPAFAGLSRVAIHRQINTALAAEFASGLHALAIETVPMPAPLQ